LSRKQLNFIVLGIMLSLFLSSMEGTVVATAMPSIVGQLGGLSIYSWVFSIFMLTSTTTVPIYGKLSDLYGRKHVYAATMVIFLIGSLLCAQARTMEQLILFRAIQGLGAGGVLPLAFTIIGDLFSLEERTKMQGLFSGVWGVSAIIGPLIGGFLVDQASWQWVFYINLIPGLAAIVLVWMSWKEPTPQARTTRVNIDIAGVILLTLAALSLLLGLNELGTSFGWWALSAALLLFIALYQVERRAADPILPLHLFRDRIFTVSILHGVFSGWAVFGSLSYVPLFVQAVLGTSATEAGISLTPMSLSWTLASILGSRLLLKMGYRTLSLIGMVLLVVGAFMMATIAVHTPVWAVMLFTGLMGTGMGLSIPAFLIAVQSSVRRSELGVATSTLQFSRSIGGTLGVSVLGAFLSSRLGSLLAASGINPASVSINSLLDPIASAASSALLAGPLRQALAIAIANMFIIAFAAAALALVATAFAPRGMLSQLTRKESALDQTPD
jgi:EmrB/QacA subfamily drug resistance transporter